MKFSQKIRELRVEHLDLKQEELAKELGCARKTISEWENGKTEPDRSTVLTICNKCNLPETFFNDVEWKRSTKNVTDNDCISVTYRPNVYLSAGYGIEVSDEAAETMVLDKRLFVSDRGTCVNPKTCEIVRVSGNSMHPEYRHGDRVIINLADRELSDGHMFAFRYKGETYVKELNLLGDKIKCISLNKEYDPFYIDKNEDFQVFGKIIPRVRL